LLAEVKPEVEEAVVAVRRLNWSERRRARAFARLKANLDQNSLIADAKEDGNMEGKLDDARRMKAMGMTPKTIMRATGLSKEQVE
jgi:predicted transposase/invertase (TIGR01784 family)